MTEKKTRRRPAEVRALLLDGAARVFAERGFDSATTAEIAAAAGVSQSALFRHFPTKSELFAAAAVEPFSAFMEEFRETYARQRERGLAGADLMRGFITDLYDNIDGRRDVVLALLTARDDAAHHELVVQARTAFIEMFAEMQAIGADWEAALGADLPSLELTERIVIGMVSTMVLFDQWFLALPDGRTFPREAVIDALINVARHGAGHNR